MRATSAAFCRRSPGRKLVRQSSSDADGRERFLTLTATGAKAVAQLDRQSTAQIEEMLAHLTEADRQSIAASLVRVRSILAAPPKPQVRIERVRASSDEALGNSATSITKRCTWSSETHPRASKRC